MYFRDKGKDAVTLPQSAQGKNALKQINMSKTKKLAPSKKVVLELLHQRLGHISTI